MKDWEVLSKEIRSDPLYRRVCGAISEHSMISAGDRVLAGLSGGADSVCLFLILRAMQESISFRLEALHVQHGLRESAEEDLAFSRQLCAETGVPFEAVHVDVCAYMEEERIGAEEAARILRRKALRSAAGGDGKIALAHHMEDQAETVLFHLLRGSSLRGMAGMRPSAEGLIRPLFYETREEIERFLREKEISWQTDETNADPGYTRNFLRLKVMPLLEAVNKGAQSHLARAGEEAAEIERFLAQRTQEARRRCVLPQKDSPETAVDIAALRSEDRLIRKRILYGLLAEEADSRKDLQEKHIEALLALCEGTGEGSVSLPGGITGLRSYGTLYLMHGPADSAAYKDRWPLSASGYQMQVLPFDGDMEKVPRNEYTKWLDYDKIASLQNAGPVLRRRQRGDTVTLEADGRKKSLARCMIDMKIPRRVRDDMVLPALGSEILWIPGGRISAAFMVSPGTARVLQITWEPFGERTV